MSPTMDETVNYAVDRLAFWGVALGAFLIIAIILNHIWRNHE